jgi:hypothetical protein
MTWLVLTSLCVLVGGLVLMSRNGVPESVSGLVYNLSERMRWAWSGWLIVVAMTLMVPLMNALYDVAWLGWLTVVCLIGAGVTPVINQETRVAHHVCGIAAGVLSQVCVACLCPWWLLVWALWHPLLAGAMAALNDAEEMPCLMAGHSVFVAECTCALSLCGCLLCVI